MKKYFFLFFLINHLVYGMDTTIPTLDYDDFYSYLPVAFMYCQYYDPSFIQKRVAPFDQKEYLTLKQHALPVAQKTSTRINAVIKGYEDKKNTEDGIYKNAKNLHDALETALKDWEHDTSFHPLLFLQYKTTNPVEVILEEPAKPEHPAPVTRNKYSKKSQNNAKNHVSKKTKTDD